MSDILLGRQKKPAEVSVLTFALPAGVLTLCLCLWLLSSPSHIESRLKAVEAQAATVNGASTETGNLKVFPAGSVCSGEFSDADRQKLNTSLANTGLKVEGLNVTDIGVAGRTGLEAYRLSFKGNGAYASAISALAAMNAMRPKLFVDSLALRNHVDSVELEVEGRLFCR